MVTALHPDHFESLLHLSDALRTDHSPCSYWSLTQEQIKGWMEEEKRTDLTILQDGAVAGIASLQQGGRHQIHLGEISVAIHPEHRRSGLARILISEIEQAAHPDIEIIKALIWVENHPSRKLFESLGYEHKATLMAEFKNETGGEIDDAVYYKRLA